MNRKKYIFISFVIFFIFILFHNNVFAVSDIVTNMNPSSSTANATSGTSLLNTMSAVFSVLQFAGTGISIIAVMKLGISYMFSSIEEKAEIKKKAAPILIGSFLIVSTVNILKFVQIFISDSFAGVGP